MCNKLSVLLIFIVCSMVISLSSLSASAAPDLPGAGEEVSTGDFVIAAGETATLEGILSGDTTLLNSGTLHVGNAGGFKGLASVINEGTVSGDLKVWETAQLSNTGHVESLSQNDNTFTSPNGTAANVRLFADDDSSIGIQIVGTVEKIDADVLSPANSAFLLVNCPK